MNEPLKTDHYDTLNDAIESWIEEHETDADAE